MKKYKQNIQSTCPLHKLKKKQEGSVITIPVSKLQDIGYLQTPPVISHLHKLADTFRSAFLSEWKRWILVLHIW